LKCHVLSRHVLQNSQISYLYPYFELSRSLL
jgi:hypothetical protein